MKRKLSSVNLESEVTITPAPSEYLMNDVNARRHLRRRLEAHLIQLGYSKVRARRAGTIGPEIVRMSPVRGRLVYGETVLRADLRRRHLHERLLRFSQRRTRHRSTILFFIAVAESDQQGIEVLLEQLAIRSPTRGGHVYVVPIADTEQPRRRSAVRRRTG